MPRLRGAETLLRFDLVQCSTSAREESVEYLARRRHLRFRTVDSLQRCIELCASLDQLDEKAFLGFWRCNLIDKPGYFTWLTSVEFNKSAGQSLRECYFLTPSESLRRLDGVS